MPGGQAELRGDYTAGLPENRLRVHVAAEAAASHGSSERGPGRTRARRVGHGSIAQDALEDAAGDLGVGSVQVGQDAQSRTDRRGEPGSAAGHRAGVDGSDPTIAMSTSPSTTPRASSVSRSPWVRA